MVIMECKGGETFVFMAHFSPTEVLYVCYQMSAPLTARQSTLIFGWLDPRPVLTWADVLRLKLTVDLLISFHVSAVSLAMIQSDPVQWVEHAGASLKHIRYMQPLGANPFVHFHADLADVLSMDLSFIELMRMGVTHGQLQAAGMSEITERMFKLDAEEWAMLGRRVLK